MVLETKVYKQGVVRTRLPPKASGKNPSLPLPSFRWFPAILERADSFEKTWCWERLKAGGQGDDRGWDGWMASPTQWTWVWVNSGSWWWTGRPGVLQSMGLERVSHEKLNWMSNWTELWNSRLMDSDGAGDGQGGLACCSPWGQKE